MWKECGDDTGKVYFWNREDNTTSWAPPAGWETRVVSGDEEELGEEGEGDEGEDEEEMDSKGNARLNQLRRCPHKFSHKALTFFGTIRMIF
jgi:hypothetical protein